ncbi:MAG: tyrosine-type recombinase/integrase [Proteobacteria bacterium]|nr:tyrosine-type recombinase/integrase [Pseudomonadota bacterium]
MTPIAPHIEAFLRDYLPRQRGASQHTCDSYAYGFRLLFKFAGQKLKRRPSEVGLEQIDAPLITAFLEHLETDRQNQSATRNVRLAAIKAFFRFLEHRVPAALEQIRRVYAIPFKKTDSRLVSYLTSNEVQALLDAPDPTTRMGLRDRAMLHIAFAAGLRVSELVGLRLQDVTLQPDTNILVRGKGRRERILPLWKETASVLRAWLAVREDVPVPELFVNAKGRQMSRWGFAYILHKAVKTASKARPELLDKQISPHVLRHSIAMLALKATQDIRKVSLWLGHSSTQTTEVYTRVDPAEKLEAINTLAPPKIRPGRFRPPDKFIAMLKGQSLWGVKSRNPPDSVGFQHAQSP